MFRARFKLAQSPIDLFKGPLEKLKKLPAVHTARHALFEGAQVARQICEGSVHISDLPGGSRLFSALRLDAVKCLESRLMMASPGRGNARSVPFRGRLLRERSSLWARRAAC